MSHLSADHDAVPGPEVLAAYVDGQLDALTRRRVDVWLAAHPEAAAVLAEHRQLLTMLRTAAPPEPPDEKWQAVLAEVAAALPPPRVQRLRRRPRLVAMLASAAAAVFLLGTPGDFALRPMPLDLPSLQARPIPVASAEEVEIVSIDGADLHALLVGTPPLRGALELAAAGDVELNYAEAGPNRWVPAMSDQLGAPPMFVVPMRGDPAENP